MRMRYHVWLLSCIVWLSASACGRTGLLLGTGTASDSISAAGSGAVGSVSNPTTQSGAAGADESRTTQARTPMMPQASGVAPNANAGTPPRMVPPLPNAAASGAATPPSAMRAMPMRPTPPGTPNTPDMNDAVANEGLPCPSPGVFASLPAGCGAVLCQCAQQDIAECGLDCWQGVSCLVASCWHDPDSRDCKQGCDGISDSAIHIGKCFAQSDVCFAPP
jgi:hypothetical protein